MKEELGPCAYCEREGGAVRPATRRTPHGLLCETHRKRISPSRAGHTPLSAPVKVKLDPQEALREAALAYADAEDDEDFERAEPQLEKAAVSYADSARPNRSWVYELSRRIKAGLRRLKARGGAPGPPPKLDRLGAEHAIKVHGSLRAAAAALGVGKSTVERALKRGPSSEKPGHGAVHSVRVPSEDDAVGHATQLQRLEVGLQPERQDGDGGGEATEAGTRHRVQRPEAPRPGQAGAPGGEEPEVKES